MIRINTSIAKGNKEQLSIHPERAFQLLDAAKDVGRYDHDRDVDASISIQDTIWTDKEIKIFAEYDCSNVLL